MDNQDVNETRILKSLLIGLIFTLVTSALLFLSSQTKAVKAVEIESQPPQSALVTINGSAITEEDFHMVVGIIRAQYVIVGSPETPFNFMQVMDMLLTDRMILNEATNAGLDVGDEELDTQLRGILLNLNYTQDELTQILNDQGVSWSQFREYLRDIFTRDYFLASILAGYPPENQQLVSQQWIGEKMNSAIIEFDEDTLRTFLENQQGQ